jgi:hypothetical protein
MSNHIKKVKKEPSIEQQIKRRSFLSFATFLIAGASGYAGWRWLYRSPKEESGITGNTRIPLRRALNQSELFSDDYSATIIMLKPILKAWQQSR